ncbi:hypothetical protein cyc_00077 [Cyclospora cayetanensis]|uniref:KIF-binding protein n=1 Tax=Cyclospora cayetanensis TaxID=88456 RepID=A0A1D3D1F9_9EIME|nr:hypothetical protein cyc_00077 [Cyclospora cayetanensis]
MRLLSGGSGDLDVAFLADQLLPSMGSFALSCNFNVLALVQRGSLVSRPSLSKGQMQTAPVNAQRSAIRNASKLPQVVRGRVGSFPLCCHSGTPDAALPQQLVGKHAMIKLMAAVGTASAQQQLPQPLAVAALPSGGGHPHERDTPSAAGKIAEPAENARSTAEEAPGKKETAATEEGTPSATSIAEAIQLAESLLSDDTSDDLCDSSNSHCLAAEIEAFETKEMPAALVKYWSILECNSKQEQQVHPEAQQHQPEHTQIFAGKYAGRSLLQHTARRCFRLLRRTLTDIQLPPAAVDLHDVCWKSLQPIQRLLLLLCHLLALIGSSQIATEETTEGQQRLCLALLLLLKVVKFNLGYGSQKLQQHCFEILQHIYTSQQLLARCVGAEVLLQQQQLQQPSGEEDSSADAQPTHWEAEAAAASAAALLLLLEQRAVYRQRQREWWEQPEYWEAQNEAAAAAPEVLQIALGKRPPPHLYCDSCSSRKNSPVRLSFCRTSLCEDKSNSNRVAAATLFSLAPVCIDTRELLRNIEGLSDFWEGRQQLLTSEYHLHAAAALVREASSDQEERQRLREQLRQRQQQQQEEGASRSALRTSEAADDDGKDTLYLGCLPMVCLVRHEERQLGEFAAALQQQLAALYAQRLRLTRELRQQGRAFAAEWLQQDGQQDPPQKCQQGKAQAEERGLNLEKILLKDECPLSVSFLLLPLHASGLAGSLLQLNTMPTLCLATLEDAFGLLTLPEAQVRSLIQQKRKQLALQHHVYPQQEPQQQNKEHDVFNNSHRPIGAAAARLTAIPAWNRVPTPGKDEQTTDDRERKRHAITRIESTSKRPSQTCQTDARCCPPCSLLRHLLRMQQRFLLQCRFCCSVVLLQLYTLDSWSTDHTRLSLLQSSVYRDLSFFEGSLPRVIAMYQRRCKLLEPLVQALNPQYYLDLMRQLAYELGDTYEQLHLCKWKEQLPSWEDEVEADIEQDADLMQEEEYSLKVDNGAAPRCLRHD